jgi:hypothetical protein
MPCRFARIARRSGRGLRTWRSVSAAGLPARSGAPRRPHRRRTGGTVGRDATAKGEDMAQTDPFDLISARSALSAGDLLDPAPGSLLTPREAFDRSEVTGLLLHEDAAQPERGRSDSLPHPSGESSGLFRLDIRRRRLVAWALHRARGVSRSKRQRGAVGGSQEFLGGVDESATGSVN